MGRIGEFVLLVQRIRYKTGSSYLVTNRRRRVKAAGNESGIFTWICQLRLDPSQIFLLFLILMVLKKIT